MAKPVDARDPGDHGGDAVPFSQRHGHILVVPGVVPQPLKTTKQVNKGSHITSSGGPSSTQARRGLNRKNDDGAEGNGGGGGGGGRNGAKGRRRRWEERHGCFVSECEGEAEEGKAVTPPSA